MSEEPDWSGSYQEYQQDHANAYLALAQDNARRDAQVHAFLTRALPNLLIAADRLRKQEEWPKLTRLTATLWEDSSFLPDRGPARQDISLLEAGLEAARALHDAPATCARLDSLGETWRSLGQIESAVTSFDEALTLARQLNDPASIRMTLCHLGLAWIDRDVPTALAYLREAEALSDTAITSALEIDLLSGLAIALTQQKELKAAADYLERGLTLAREHQDERRQADLLYQRGYLRTALGDYGSARADFKEAAGLLKALGHAFGYGRALQAMGTIAVQTGQHAHGVAELEQALRILEQAGDDAHMPAMLASLGQAYVLLGDMEKAREFLERALAMIETYKEIPQMAALAALLRQLFDYVRTQSANERSQ